MFRPLLLLSLFGIAFSNEVTVTTSVGQIVGQNATDGEYSTFLGIPYALVNEANPFGANIPSPTFDTPFIANDSSTSCFQSANARGSMQCLRLNIFTPHSATPESPAPVLVWIHGGIFSLGSGGNNDGKYLAEKGVVVVTINYRLGPYGFLCLDDPSVPGNQGMKDQIQALRWVQANIQAFGGDPNSVTIGGESAGGGSVDLHLYSKYERLFHKVAIHSGSSFVTGMFSKRDFNAAIKMAQYIGYNVNTTPEAIAILSAAQPSQVMGAFVGLNLELRPCQEKEFPGIEQFVTDNPYDFYAPERISQTPMMIGFDSAEHFEMYFNKTTSFYEELGDLFYSELSTYYNLGDDLDEIARIVRSFYIGDKDITVDTGIRLAQFRSDFVMYRSVETAVDKYLAQGVPVIYKWMFDFIGGTTYEDVPGAGAAHTIEVQYLFGFRGNSVPSASQQLICDRMVEMWSNFVKYDNPTPANRNTTLLPVEWTPFTSDPISRPYMNIDTEMEIKNYVFHERVAFWQLYWANYWTKSRLILADGE